MAGNQSVSTDRASCKVRRATEADVAELVLLNKDLQELHASLYPQDFKQDPDGAELSKSFSRLIDAENHSIGVYDGEDEPIGYIWFEQLERPQTPFRNPFRLLHIHHIFVKPEARGQAVGSALVEWACDHARAAGISQIAVEHWADNENAREFFKRSGFEDIRISMRRLIPTRE
jgi:ribosomal protein S18 acetylase RimI-like enzyme